MTNKNIHFGQALAAIIVLSLASYWLVSWQVSRLNQVSSRLEQSIPSKTRPGTHDESVPLPITTKTLTDYLAPDGREPVTVEYPILKSGYATPEITAKINADMASTSRAIFDEAVSDLEASAKSFQDSGSAAMADNLYYQQTVSTTTAYASRPGNTFAYTTYTGQDSGGAHGGTFYNSFSYDLNTGKRLGLQNFLKGDYKKKISAYIQSQIGKAVDATASGESVFGCEGCERLDLTKADGEMWWPNQVTLGQFQPNEDGIVFLFSDYDLGPYSASAGGQQIFVSKEVLKPYILRNW